MCTINPQKKSAGRCIQEVSNVNRLLTAKLSFIFGVEGYCLILPACGDIGERESFIFSVEGYCLIFYQRVVILVKGTDRLIKPLSCLLQQVCFFVLIFDQIILFYEKRTVIDFSC